MRVQTAVLALLLLCTTTAYADSIDRVSPQSFFAGNPEQFLELFGTGLAGSESTVVEYDGPGGQFSVDASDATDTFIDVWVPVLVTLVPGHYSVTVVANDIGGVSRTIGPVYIDVIEQVIQEPPLLGIPEAVNVEATSPSGSIVTFDATGLSQGGTGLVVTCDHNSGDLYPIGTTTVTCTATDSFGSTVGSFPLSVTDTGQPTLTLPGPIVTSNPVVTFTATATDAIDGALTVHCSPASGSTFPFGVTEVQCFAVDSSANETAGSFTVTVTGGPPVLTLPDDITAEATSAAGAAVTFTVTATENGVVSCSPASGSTFPLGTTEVQCTATNNVGSVSGAFNVTVVDTTPPNLVLPADITAEATSASGAAVPYVATATDLVDGSVTPSCTPASGSTFPLGTTTVQCTATDAHGNTASGSFSVTVQDTTPPEILSLIADPSSLWPPNHKMVAVTLTASVFDLVDPNPTVHIVSVTSNQPINGTGDGDTAPDWEITGPMTVNLRSERAGGSDRIYTITIEAVDFSGNVATKTVEVKVSQSKGRAVR